MATYKCNNIAIEKNENSEVTIKAEIPAEHLAEYRTRAIQKLGADVRLDGFREGKVPEDILIKHLGEEKILYETANTAIAEQFPLLIKEEDLALLGTPHISITKLAPNEPICFTIEGALLPEVKLPDYTAIAKQHTSKNNSVTVDDKEVEDTLTHIRRERARIERIESGMDPEQAAKEAKDLETLALPGIDEAFVTSLGYESVDHFSEKLRENIQNEKEAKEREKTRIAIIEDIIKETDLRIPNTLVEHELKNMEKQFEHDLQQAGLTMETYLQQANKTLEDARKEWQPGAEKRAKMHLIMREIAEKESIQADPQVVEQEVEHIVSKSKEADPNNVRAYVAQALRTEATFRFLEEQK